MRKNLKAARKAAQLTQQAMSDRAMESYGFSPSEFNQIIVFRCEEDFKEALAFNHNMTAIIGDDKHTKEFYPGVFIAGVKASLPRGKED